MENQNVEAELTEPEESQGDEGKGSSKDVKKEKKRPRRIHLCLVIVLEV